jgi:hypothetical protein
VVSGGRRSRCQLLGSLLRLSRRRFVAQGWHEYATRILDVRNPKDIKQVGFFFTPASET